MSQLQRLTQLFDELKEKLEFLEGNACAKLANPPEPAEKCVCGKAVPHLGDDGCSVCGDGCLTRLCEHLNDNCYNCWRCMDCCDCYSCSCQVCRATLRVTDLKAQLKQELA
jgi:hypothetical protein